MKRTGPVFVMTTVLFGAVTAIRPTAHAADREGMIAQVVESSRLRANKFVPPDGTALLLIGHDTESIDGYVRATQDIPAGFMVYTSIQHVQGLDSPANLGAGTNHARDLLKRYPHTILQIGLWMVGALQATTQGTYDANLDRLGKFLKQTRRPVFLRIGYEFDFGPNGYEPRAYVRAYRYVVDHLRRQGVKNVAYVWHSHAAEDISPMGWYPGDDYVDWFAVSYFDQDRRHLDPMAELAQAHGKPLMIAEATPRGIGTLDERLWGQWFRSCQKYIDEQHVRALCYINTDWDAQPMFRGRGWQDSRVEANKAVEAIWRRETMSGRYLHASPTLYEQLGPASP